MGSQFSPDVRPTADWIGRFAGHTIALMPDVSPLDAVRRGLAAFETERTRSPEEAAERQSGYETERALLGALAAPSLGAARPPR